MTNADIARRFNLLGKLMELHGENPFKYRSYYKAYNILRKVEAPLVSMTVDDLMLIEGIGKNIANKIVELSSTGGMQTLTKMQDLTPQGVQDMLLVRGFGPKKVRLVWDQLGVENIGELLYACQENRLVKLKGFGAKTQADLITSLQYHLASKGKFHLGKILPKARIVLASLVLRYPDSRNELTGEIRRLCNVVEQIDIVTTLTLEEVLAADQASFSLVDHRLTFDGLPLTLHAATNMDFGTVLAHTTGPDTFVDGLTTELFADEHAVFDKSDRSYVLPELRDWELTDSPIDAATVSTADLITVGDIKGIVHNHSTYSDGIHSLDDMASYCHDQGFEYLVMSDHSQYAGYANGLKPDRVAQQQREIDDINSKYSGFKVFKSIECDILPSGELDYTEEVLQSFDLLVCSVHAGLKMSESKAMERLTRAIASPYCHILGHMTGRLLLSRQGYPVDHREIIDLCSEYNVAIELNANPYRLDMDWRYIPYAMEKGVSISINPDAHSKEAIHYIEWGVASARKGGLTADACLNTKDLAAFELWIDGLPSR